MRLAAVTGLVCLALVASPASAGLIEVDVFLPGDGLITRDTTSGLEWLDLPYTAGFSYDEILDNAGGLVAGGWRHATTGEVCHLMAEMGFAPAPCPGVSPVVPGDATSVHLAFLGILTVIPGNGSGSAALFDDGNPGNPAVGQAAIGNFFETSSVVVEEDCEDPGVADPEVAHFLVRRIPSIVPALPPGGIPLLAGLLILAGRAARRRAAALRGGGGGSAQPLARHRRTASPTRSTPHAASTAWARDSGTR